MGLETLPCMSSSPEPYLTGNELLSRRATLPITFPALLPHPTPHLPHRPNLCTRSV